VHRSARTGKNSLQRKKTTSDLEEKVPRQKLNMKDIDEIQECISEPTRRSHDAEVTKKRMSGKISGKKRVKKGGEQKSEWKKG